MIGRKTGGRQKGTPNKAAAEIRSLAQAYGPAAIAALARLAGLTDEPGADAEATRVVAIKELLDRGYGRAILPLAGADEAPPMTIEFSWAPEPAQSNAPSHDAAAAATAAVIRDDPLCRVGGVLTDAPIGPSIASHA